MQATFFFILVMAAFVAGTDSTAAENTVQTQITSPDLKPPHATRHLKGSHMAKKDVDLSEEEERGATQALARFKGIFGKHPNKPTKLTDDKLQKIKTYAKENPDKWDQMTYYLDNVYGISLMALLAGGSLFLGWRYVGAGTSA
ncbi:hypothetical protein PRNP1_012328 [Phytophthora ramorum]